MRLALFVGLSVLFLAVVVRIVDGVRHRRPERHARHPQRPAGPLRSAAGLLATLDVAAAHNWINSPKSRATKASTVAPCLPRTGSIPGVRANPNQDFLIEWASGHPGSVCGDDRTVPSA